MTGNSSWSFSSLYRSTILFKANTEGRWEDINESCEGIYFFWFRMLQIFFIAINKESEAIMEFFASGQDDEEHKILGDIKGSFSIWRKCKETPLEFPFLGTDSFYNISLTKKFLKCLKYFFILLGLIISVGVIGILIGLSRNL